MTFQFSHRDTHINLDPSVSSVIFSQQSVVGTSVYVCTYSLLVCILSLFCDLLCLDICANKLESSMLHLI